MIMPNMDEVVRQEREEALKSLAEATPGPWAVDGKYVVQDKYDKDDYRQAVFKAQHIPKMEPDSYLIANAPTWLRNSLDREEQLIKDVTDARGKAEEAWREIDELESKVEHLIAENERVTKDRDEAYNDLRGVLSQLDTRDIQLGSARTELAEQDTEIQYWKDRADRVETLLEGIMHGEPGRDQCEDCGEPWKLGDPTTEIEEHRIKCLCKACWDQS
jgi:hypothetical protein